jgi:hypothetical protein
VRFTTIKARILPDPTSLEDRNRVNRIEPSLTGNHSDHNKLSLITTQQAFIDEALKPKDGAGQSVSLSASEEVSLPKRDLFRTGTTSVAWHDGRDQHNESQTGSIGIQRFTGDGQGEGFITTKPPDPCISPCLCGDQNRSFGCQKTSASGKFWVRPKDAPEVFYRREIDREVDTEHDSNVSPRNGMGQRPPCKHECALGSEAKMMTDYHNPLVKQPDLDCNTVGPLREVKGVPESPRHVNIRTHALRDVTCCTLSSVGDSEPERIETRAASSYSATNQAPQDHCLATGKSCKPRGGLS